MQNLKSATAENSQDINSGQLSKNIKEVVNNSLGQVKENLSEYYEKGKDQLVGVEKKIEGKIREYPLKSLLIAGGIGLVLGMLCRRK